MEEYEKITITNPDGKDVEYELVTTIEDEKKDTKYIVYKDLIDNEDSDDVELYISKIIIEDGEEIIEEIEDDNEWEKVSKILDEMFKDIQKDPFILYKVLLKHYPFLFLLY